MSGEGHTLVNPAQLGAPSGFSHAVAAAAGTTVYLAGQVGSDAAGAVTASDLVTQLDLALGRVVVALAAAGGQPRHVVSMVIHTTAMGEYRRSLPAVGAVYRGHFGRHYPAMTLVAVAELVDPAAVVEVTATAVVPAAAPG